MTYNEERDAEHAARVAWLAGLKVGDKVATDISDRYNAPSLATIVRVTPTQFILDRSYANKYRRKDGGQVGGGYGKTLQPITQMVLDRIEESDLRSWLTHLTIGHKYPKLAVMRAMKRGFDEATAA